MAKSRTHEVVVRVYFDKAITRTEAVKEFRDMIHGDFYPGCYSEAEEMTIKRVRSLPETKKRIDR